MAVKTTKKLESRPPKVIACHADYYQSGTITEYCNGERILLERGLMLITDNPEFVKALESAKSYNLYGRTSFWTGTIGTNLQGYYKINPKGKTLKSMLTYVSDDFDSNVKKISFNKRVYVRPGNNPLLMTLRRQDLADTRLIISGSMHPDVDASTVVSESKAGSYLTLIKAAERGREGGLTRKY